MELRSAHPLGVQRNSQLTKRYEIRNRAHDTKYSRYEIKINENHLMKITNLMKNNLTAKVGQCDYVGVFCSTNKERMKTNFNLPISLVLFYYLKINDNVMKTFVLVVPLYLWLKVRLKTPNKDRTCTE